MKTFYPVLSRFCKLCLALGFLLSTHVDARDFIVAVNGSDSGKGTVGNPLKTLRHAVTLVAPGDRILLRKGTHFLDQTVRITTSGTASKRISLAPYRNERAIIDGSRFSTFDSDLEDNSNLMLNGADYWSISRIEIRKAPFYGIQLRSGANNNRLQRLKVYDNGGTGIEIVSGSGSNLILNVDSYRNFDRDDNGQDADGFSAKFDVGTGNIFRGCRAWANSDDGWDLWRAGNPVRVIQCWAFDNGFDIWGHGPSFEGNGNGFKFGQGGGKHFFLNNLAWGNSTRGFDDNNNSSGATLHNNTAWNNPTNYRLNTGAIDVAKNNLSYQGSVELASATAAGKNSWDLNLQLSQADFLTLDDTLSKGSREANGALPYSGFLRLVKSSAAVDRGANIGRAFAGSAPDLGFYEWGLAKAGSGQGERVVPAESLDLVGYQIEARSDAEGKKVIKGTLGQTNTGQFNFSGYTGRYDISVRYFDEGDGAARIQLRVENNLVGNWTANANNETYRTRVIKNINIASGDTIKVTGITNGGEHARIDSIRLTPGAATLSNGIFFEAEEAANQSSFSPFQVKANLNAAGRQYIVVPNGTGNNGATLDEGTLEFNFQTASSETVEVWLRSHANNGGDNSVWLQMNGDTPRVVNLPISGSTYWRWHKARTYTVEAGLHKLNLSYREDGAEIDQIFIGTGAQNPSLGVRDSFYVEAEDAVNQSRFSPFEVKFNNALGSEYIVVPNGSGNNPNGASNQDNGRAEYTFKLEQASTVVIWINRRATNAGNDSFYRKLNGGNWVSAGTGTSANFTWRKYVTYTNLAAGDHIFRLLYREDGTELDQLFITTDVNATP